MTVLSAQSLRRMRPVEPFYERAIEGGMTFGLGPCGYDVRIAQSVVLMPQQFVLASTIERFTMPTNIRGVVHDKSSWARRGLAVQNTVIEPGWCGYLTLELTNHGTEYLRIAAGTPIAQIGFEWLDEPTDQPYAGKYQDQPAGPQPAIDE